MCEREHELSHKHGYHGLLVKMVTKDSATVRRRGPIEVGVVLLAEVFYCEGRFEGSYMFKTQPGKQTTSVVSKSRCKNLSSVSSTVSAFMPPHFLP